MKSYDDYFADSAIIATLCRIRLNRANSIHRRRFYRKAFELGTETDYSELNRLFPPRKQWHSYRPRKEERKKYGQPTFNALLRCVNKNRAQQPTPAWATELNQFITRLQQRVLHEKAFTFRTPEISPEPKKNPNEFRAIASFPNIEDKIVDIINAKYLRECLEVCLEDSSRAFRSGQNRKLDRNSAIDAIYRIREEHPEKPLFVTECDIRGFFDCVHHSVAKDALNRARQTLKIRHPDLQIDSRAIAIFKRYLDCYTFSQTTLALEPELKRRTKNPAAAYKWPLGGNIDLPNTLEHYHASPKRCRIGVPQGGAHSCLIANLVLDLADKEVSLTLQATEGNSLYLRYCDDIIIITEDETACRRATECYYLALRAVKLPYHLATELDGTPKQFFENSKTKECFLWGPKNFSKRQFPWLQFLGYQIRFDGRIRIRPSSISKQRKKIEALSQSLREKTSGKRVKVSHRRLLHRFDSKLWAFSSGRVQIHTEHQEPLPMCWASGFRQLTKHRFHARHIKKLDQVAGAERRRLIRHLKKFPSGPKAEKKEEKGPSKSKQLQYFGKPFSHQRQFKDTPNPD